MATCEELQAEITALEAALIVDAAAIQAAQNVQYAHQMQLWYTQYNFYLQGCGGGGSSSGSSYSMSTERGTQFVARQLQETAVQKTMPKRSATEMLIITRIPELYALHKRCEAFIV